VKVQEGRLEMQLSVVHEPFFDTDSSGFEKVTLELCSDTAGYQFFGKDCMFLPSLKLY
jgi:hypothetical protein